MIEPSFEQVPPTTRPHDGPVSLPKILLISALAFATLIPTFFVSGLITERGIAEASPEGLRALFPERT